MRIGKTLIALVALATLLLGPGAAWASLIAHYPLDEIVGGTTTPDATGLNGDGTLNGGPTVDATAQFGSAFRFSGGTGEFVGIQDPTFGKTQMTASIWFRPDSLGQHGPLANWTNTGPSPRSTLMRTDGGNVQTFLRRGSVQKGGAGAFPSAAVTTAEFNHLVVSYDGQYLFTYLNGEKSTDVFDFGSVGPIGEGVLGILALGGRGGSERDLVGLADDAAFWDELLPDAQIFAIHSLGTEPALMYNAGEVNQILEAFEGMDSVTVEDLLWSSATELDPNLPLGQVALIDGTFYLRLGDDRGVIGGNVIPEPGTLALVGLGLLGYARRRRRRRAAERTADRR